MTPTTIGFVGLGHMGGNMAARLLAAGYPVSGESRSRDAVEHLIGEGLTWRDTPREVAENVEIVLTSIPNDDVLRDRQRDRRHHTLAPREGLSSDVLRAGPRS